MVSTHAWKGEVVVGEWGGVGGVEGREAHLGDGSYDKPSLRSGVGIREATD